MKKIKDLLFGGKNIQGEVGIEIEMEGKQFPMEDLDSWYSRHDGSLRGKEGDKREYVLIRPCKRDGIVARLNSLKVDLLEFGSEINPSYRTGVHIHINIRDLSFSQAWCFIFTYLMLEDAMMKFCGEGREGNLFCLRNRDAEDMMYYMERAIKSKNFKELFTDNIRYSSMNLKAIKQYGSIEFRGLSFSGDFDNISIWADLLLAVKDWSLQVGTPINLVEYLSKNEGEVLAREIFKDKFFFMPAMDWHKSMLDGIRRAQKLIYLREWEEIDRSFTLKTNIIPNEDKAEVDPVRIPAKPRL